MRSLNWLPDMRWKDWGFYGTIQVLSSSAAYLALISRGRNSVEKDYKTVWALVLAERPSDSVWLLCCMERKPRLTWAVACHLGPADWDHDWAIQVRCITRGYKIYGLVAANYQTRDVN